MADPAARAAIALRGARLPAGLGDLTDRPDALYVLGAWPMAPMVAIVGARAATDYGRTLAHRLAGDLVRLGYAVVSGLARGIDAAAHQGALDAGGVTIAVLPGSLDRVTPPSHAALATKIMERGALVAEWERGKTAWPGSFLERNRLIAALSRAVVVVEAAERSGALSTATHAFGIGRPVLAVPGDVDRETSRGCHALLRRGAAVCEGAADVLAALAPGADPREARRVTRSMRGRADEMGVSPDTGAALGEGARLAAALDAEPRTLDGLARRAGLTPERTLATLVQLEWAGVATAHPGSRWSARGGRA